MSQKKKARKGKAKKWLSIALVLVLGLSTLSSLIPRQESYATAPTAIAPGSGALPSDYIFQLSDYTNSYVNFATNFYADQIDVTGTYAYFTNIALGSASNPTNNFGLGIQSGNATINAIGTNTVTTGITCDVATFCYPFYYYNLGQTLSRISVVQGSTTTAIPVSSFTTDFSAFSVMAAPAVFWDPTTRYYEVKVYYTGTTSISFESNTGGTGINPVSFESTATVYSVASDPDFQRVYEDTVNNKALFFDAEPSNGTYFESSYDIASGISTNTATGITNGGNTVNSATYFSPVELNGYIWAVGRDSTTGKNVYALRSTSALAAVNATSQASSYIPQDIAQSTTKLYSPLYSGATQYGSLYLGNMARGYTGYGEPLLYTGTSGVPAQLSLANQAASDLSNTLYGASNTVITEKFTSTAAMHGKSFNSFYVSLSKTGSPTGNATLGTFDASGNVVTTFATLDVSTLTTSQASYYFTTPLYTVQTNDRIGIKYTGGDASNLVNVFFKNSNVYDGTNAFYSSYAGSWTDTTTVDLMFGMRIGSAKVVTYDGSPDTEYVFFEDGNNEIKVVKYNGSATLLSGSMTSTNGQPYQVVQLTDKMLIQTLNDTYVLPRATDTISLLYPNTFNTRYAQTFLLSPGGRTYSSNTVYIANSTYAINFTPSLGTGAQTGVIISSVDDATGTMNVYAPAKYLYLTGQNLTVESSTLAGTTWTIQQLGSLVQLAPTAYSEHLGINLVQNNTLYSQDLFRLVCGAAAYHYVVPLVAIGDDSGCTGWRVVPDSSTTIGREIFIPYTRTPDLVHTSPMSAYTFTINAGTPTYYSIKSIYDGKVVDEAYFDSSGQASQRYLFNECYTVQVTNTNSGQSALAGNICANDATTKPIDVNAVQVPVNWQGSPWATNSYRNYTNPSSNTVTFTVDKNEHPWNVTIHVVDNQFATPTYDQWFNYTNQNSVQTITITGISGNQTLYFDGYENGVAVFNSVVSGQGLSLNGLGFLSLGSIFGIPIAGMFVIIIGGVFTRSSATFGFIAVLATIGVMVAFGLLNINPAFWAALMGVAAVGIFAYKRLT